MTTQTATYTELIEQLTPEATLTLRGIGWETYEELLAAVGEAPSLRISYNDGMLQVMTLSFEHEYFSECLGDLMGVVRLVWGIKILAFGSATLKQQQKLKGAEPDACFYVTNADALGSRFRLDLDTDPPPDIVVEVDVHHESKSKFPIYAALGVPELWHYDGTVAEIYQLQAGQYSAVPMSPALPMLTSQTLTDFLARCQEENQSDAVLAFAEWLRTQPR